MNCPRCGAPVRDDATACLSCAAPIATADVAARFTPDSASRGSEAAGYTLSTPADNLTGLGGWLIIVGLGLLAGLIIRAFEVVSLVRISNQRSMLALISDPENAGYIPHYDSLLRFELTGNLVMLFLFVALLILFVRESRWFPRIYIGSFVLMLIFAATDHIMLSHALSHSSAVLQQRMAERLSNGAARLVGTAGGVILWICYMVKSERVRNTFVR